MIETVQSITKSFAKCKTIPETKKICKEILKADNYDVYDNFWINDKEKKLKKLRNEISEKTLDSKHEKFSALEKIDEAEIKLQNLKSKTFAKSDTPSKANVKWSETLPTKHSYLKNEISPKKRNFEGTDFIDSKISSLMNKYKEGEIDSLEDELISLKRNIVSQMQGPSVDYIRTEDYDSSTMRNTGQGNLGKSMRRLQETLSQKERADYDKINMLSIRNDDMKETIKELIKKIEELEDVNAQKSQKNAEDQIELSSLSKEIMYLKERIQDSKDREEKMLNTEAELQQEIIHMKSKLSEKKSLTQEISDLNNHIHKQNSDIKDKDLQM